MDNADSADLLQRLRGFQEDAALAARLADVQTELAAWLNEGDAARGVLAADALDQLQGLLGDLANDAQALVPKLAAILAELPPPPE